MADLFISYGLRETLWVSKLVRTLNAEGYTVSWEHAAAPGDDVRTNDSIQALNNAQCVLAVWSDTSVDDHWVLSDAERALQQNKLISVVARSAVIPLAFRRNETVFMQNWDARTNGVNDYGKLLAAISAFVTPSQPSEFERKQEWLARQQRMKAEAKQRKQAQCEREQRARLRRDYV